MRIRFVTSTPLDIQRGSGTYVGIYVLARALERLGHRIDYATPRRRFPIYTAQRLAFNWRLRPDPEFDLTVGFDMDGYRIAKGAPHIASLKGVIADEVRFESGFTRWTMSIQAEREKLHVQRAAGVLATSLYSAEQARRSYGLRELPAVVPELIDLTEWRRRLAAEAPGDPDAEAGDFRILFVGRFYRRKRVDVLLRAAAALRGRIPRLRVRIVGNGPCRESLRALARELRLDDIVDWLGDVSRAQLAAEYNRASVFCLPSAQEGFGIVLLEAMAANKPIVAARAGAIPEVARWGLMVEPESAEALAAGVEQLHRSPDLSARLVKLGAEWVGQFDAHRVARKFLDTVGRIVRRRSTYTSA